jgi:hypothetical protein
MKTDDIEELFREAAEKYQIDTEKAAAWDDVHDAVHKDDKPVEPTPRGNNGNNRWLNLLWLLLIPLGWFAHTEWNDLQNKKTAINQQAKSKNVAEKNGGSPTNNAIVTAGDTKSAIKSSTTATTAVTNTAAVNNAATFSAKSFAGNKAQSVQIITGGILKGGSKPLNKISTGDAQVNSAPPVSNGSTSQAPSNVNSSVTNNSSKQDDTNMANATPQNNPIVQNENVAQENKSNDKKPQKDANNQRFFYLGLIASPDVSFIHFQKTSPMGVGGGLLAGYKFNKHLSIETGVLFDSKNYYTVGKYFDRSNIPFFKQHPEIIVNKVNGDCKMIEVPVNIQYTFLSRNKNSWYGDAGISSYFMGREYYNYDLSDWGNSYQTSLEYNNHIKNWFSVANFGIGYERSLGLKTNLRIEPFIKVPVSGVGTGNLAITSTGLYIGLTRRIP